LGIPVLVVPALIGIPFPGAPASPPGGIIIWKKKGILDRYRTGRVRIKVRAKVHIEQLRNREIIVIDEATISGQ